MSIWYNGSGTFLLKKECAKNFSDKVFDMVGDYSKMSNNHFTLNEKNIFKFEYYANHNFMCDFVELLEQNVESVKEAQIWFSCYDEDSFDEENGFPFMYFIEIVNGKLYEQALYKRLPAHWEHYVNYEKSEEEILQRKKEIEQMVKKNVIEKDDLPF